MPEREALSLEAVERRCLNALAGAPLDKRSPFRWPVLSTATAAGAGAARIVVLRAFDRTRRLASLWTDRRSPKIADLQANPSATLLFFDRSSMVQMRARGSASILTSGNAWQAAFERAHQAGLDDYTAEHPPGAPIADPQISFQQTLAPETFTLVEIEIAELDWLSLSKAGHRRALLNWQSGGAHSWLTP